MKDIESRLNDLADRYLSNAISHNNPIINECIEEFVHLCISTQGRSSPLDIWKSVHDHVADIGVVKVEKFFKINFI